MSKKGKNIIVFSGGKGATQQQLDDLKEYVDESIMGITGALAGKNCTIVSNTHQDGVTTVVFQWTADDGTVNQDTISVLDGTPILVWIRGRTYHYGDIVIYESNFYRCIIENHDNDFDDTKWNEIGSPDGNYDIVQTSALLPPRFTSADRKIYYVISEGIFYLWNGVRWEPQTGFVANGETAYVTGGEVYNSVNAVSESVSTVAGDLSDEVTARENADTAINEKIPSEASASNKLTDKNYVDNLVEAHVDNTNNPHSVTKEQIGLGNADNTSDVDKPVSTATQTALDAKQPKNLSQAVVIGGESKSTVESAIIALNDAKLDAGSLAAVATSGSYTDLEDTPSLGTASEKNVAASGNASLTEVVLGNDSRLTDARNAADVYDWAKAETKPAYSAGEVGAIATSLKGASNGVAELDSNGKVPSTQLPSYVDDVVEGVLYEGRFYTDEEHTTEITGETGKIYIDYVTNKTYRWSGTAFVEISESLALGETSSTAYAGNKGKANADAIFSLQSSKVDKTTTVNGHALDGNVTVSKSDVGLGNVDNTADADKAVASAGKLTTARKVYVKLGTASTTETKDFSGDTAIPVNGTLGVANGGTGKTTLADAANDLINALSEGSSDPQDDDFYVCQYSGGGTSTKTYYRRPISKLWNYISGKISSVLGLTSSSYGGNSASAKYAIYSGQGAYCDTAAGTKAKVASMKDYVLQSGAVFLITFKYSNTANDALTLAVNGTTAKPIYINNAVSSSSNKTLPAGTYLCRYNGTNYYIDTGYFVSNARTANTASYATNLGTSSANYTKSTLDTALNNKQPKTLSSSITIDGTARTTVEAALSALNAYIENSSLHTDLSVSIVTALPTSNIDEKVIYAIAVSGSSPVSYSYYVRYEGAWKTLYDIK